MSRSSKILSVFVSLTLMTSGCCERTADVDIGTELVIEESTSSDTSNEETTVPIPEGALVDYQSRVYEGTTKIRVCDLCEFDIPLSVAESLVDASEMQSRMAEIIGDEAAQDISFEKWHESFNGQGYFLDYGEAALIMHDEFILQINLLEADSDTANLMEVLDGATEVSTFNTIFSKVIQQSLYGAKGFSMLTRSGQMEGNGNKILSYIFAAETEGFSLTDGYFGFFIVGYSPNTSTLMVCMISGLSGISDPRLTSDTFSSFDNVQENGDYWAVLERRV